jgi:hypothetical protein
VLFVVGFARPALFEFSSADETTGEGDTKSGH